MSLLLCCVAFENLLPFLLRNLLDPSMVHAPPVERSVAGFVLACAASGRMVHPRCDLEGETRDEEGEQSSLKDERNALKMISEANPACDEKQL